MKAKLALHERVFDCDTCGTQLDRDVNAAHNIAAEALRLDGLQGSTNGGVAGLRPETRNADSKLPKSMQGDLLAAVA